MPGTAAENCVGGRIRIMVPGRRNRRIYQANDRAHLGERRCVADGLRDEHA